MYDQPDANQAQARYKTKDGINANGQVLVQGMETDTAPGRIIYRLGQQVIQVNQHRRHEDKPGSFPVVPEECESNDSRDEEMQGYVEHVGRVLLFVTGKLTVRTCLLQENIGAHPGQLRKSQEYKKIIFNMELIVFHKGRSGSGMRRAIAGLYWMFPD